MQLASKMRFVGVQFEVLFGTILWLRSATHANAMARRLADATRDIAGVQLTREPEANSVYAILPADVTARLQEQVFFYPWDRATGEVRWVCAFDTTEQTSTTSPTWSARKWPTASTCHLPPSEGIRSAFFEKYEPNSFTDVESHVSGCGTRPASQLRMSETKTWPLPVDALFWDRSGNGPRLPSCRSPMSCHRWSRPHPDSVAPSSALDGRVTPPLDDEEPCTAPATSAHLDRKQPFLGRSSLTSPGTPAVSGRARPSGRGWLRI